MALFETHDSKMFIKHRQHETLHRSKHSNSNILSSSCYTELAKETNTVRTRSKVVKPCSALKVVESIVVVLMVAVWMIFHLHFNTNTGDFEDHYIDLKPISPPSAEINDSSLFIVDAGKETLNYSHRPRPQQTTTSSTTIVVENNRTIGKTEPVVHGGGGGGGGCNSTSMPQRGAPWNPAKNAGRGGKMVLDACMSELKSTKCNASLPVSLCLRDKLDATNFSTACRKKLFPCQIKSGRDSRAACQESKIFSQKLNGDEIDRMEDILDRIDKASQMGVNCNSSEPLLFWMTAGSIMGSLIHHSVIPWDDDVDIFVVEEHINFFKENLEVLGLKTVPMKAEGHEDRVIKIFNPSNPTLRKRHTFTFPFIDMFVVRCSDDTKECVEFKSKKKHLISYDDLFPLKRRPFGALSMPFPAKSDTHCMKRYGQNYKSLCVRGSFDHKRDIWLGRDSTVVMNCSDMMLAFPMVTKQEQSPFEHDFPFMTIEQLVDGTGSQLQTVIFDDGNEVRRIYAENLIGLQDNKISYTLQYPENSNTHLLPYLLEERQRFLENPMEKTSEELNMEVMPMLNKVVISNHHGKASDNLRNKRNLYLGEWNAERGSNWQVFQDFYPKADIIILNEMDWGMARSQNIHTTEIMASSLKMNYAYGVEFLELTNGNQAEQNATRNEENLIGYHGNVVLSKWPIIKSSIIRLHPLHDLLYKEKNSGQAKGERRLGGRMALFTVTSTGIGDILVISMHAHSGSKGHLLKQDAITVCNSIEDWNVSNVLIGGDIANPIPQYLASTCGFYDLNKTNSFSLKKNKFVPTWRLVCNEGKHPRVARFPTRGDWILVKGPLFNETSSDKMVPNTIYPYKKYLQEGDEKYECVSDHAIITVDIPLTK